MKQENLEALANELRTDIVRMIAAAGSGHPGGSLSCADILCALYFGDVLTYDPKNPSLEGRDRFILAKGHAVPALYATLAHAGYFEHDELLTLRKLGSRLQGHPDSSLVPGVEVSTGSLGQGLSIAAGYAAGLRLKGEAGYVFSLLGDGECEEGQVWEAAMFASHNKLGNLVAIIDRNGLQIDGPTECVCDPGDLGAKFSAFGWGVHEVDGHDIDELISVLSKCKMPGGTGASTSLKGTSCEGIPQLIIANTIKGKGVSFMENEVGWHGKAPKADELERALSDLAGACVKEVCHD